MKIGNFWKLFRHFGINTWILENMLAALHTADGVANIFCLVPSLHKKWIDRKWKKKRKISWRGARSWRQLWGHLQQNFHNFTTFWKSEKKGKNELELTSKLTSPPTKVFTSGKTSYTKTSLKKKSQIKSFFFTKSCSLSFFSLKSSNQPYLKFPYFFQIVLLEVPKFSGSLKCQVAPG